MIIFQRDFFGKIIFSGRMEKENMVFRVVLIAHHPILIIVKMIGIVNILALGEGPTDNLNSSAGTLEKELTLVKELTLLTLVK